MEKSGNPIRALSRAFHHNPPPFKTKAQIQRRQIKVKQKVVQF